MISLLNLRQHFPKDIYGLIMRKLTKYDIIMIYLAHGCNVKLEPSLMDYFVDQGNLECIKYLRERGCPWGHETNLKAYIAGRRECIDYIEKNGCAADILTTMFLANRGIEPYRSVFRSSTNLPFSK